MKLPFPDYSWLFSQHAIALEPRTLFALLEYASFFEGRQKVDGKNVGQAITQLIVAAKILTENKREGKADAWRDYQQVLPELGLLVSTKLSPAIMLTDAGRMLLSGDIGFAELMSLQALRYQYPNGFKNDVMEQQAENGVLVKPGLLILRILIELHKRAADSFLAVSECEHCLVPVRQNVDWPSAMAAILKYRAAQNVTLANRRRRRNVQDWFKFLSRTDLFELSHSRQELSLTNFARNHIDDLSKYCDRQELPQTFWYPTKFDTADRYSWADHFGQVPPLEEQILQSETELTAKYIARNYVGGFEDDFESESLARFDETAPGLKLGPLQDRKPLKAGALSQHDLLALGKKTIEGMALRQAKTTLHDSIVRDLADRFTIQRAEVMEDRDSADLLVKWPTGEEALIEVKTVTRRSLQDRLRSATGQILEYSYRRKLQVGASPDSIIVINSAIPQAAWQTLFLTSHLNIGLVCKSKGVFTGFSDTSQPHRTFKYWRSL